MGGANPSIRGRSRCPGSGIWFLRLSGHRGSANDNQLYRCLVFVVAFFLRIILEKQYNSHLQILWKSWGRSRCFKQNPLNKHAAIPSAHFVSRYSGCSSGFSLVAPGEARGSRRSGGQRDRGTPIPHPMECHRGDFLPGFCDPHRRSHLFLALSSSAQRLPRR